MYIVLVHIAFYTCQQGDAKDEVFYVEGGRPAAEFVACLYLTYTRKYKRRLKVHRLKNSATQIIKI